MTISYLHLQKLCKKVCAVRLNLCLTETQLRTMNVKMVQAMRIYSISDDQNKRFLTLFQHETKHIFSVFLSSKRNTRGSLVEINKAVETHPCNSWSTVFLVLSNLHSCFFKCTCSSIKIRKLFAISHLIAAENCHWAVRS